MRKILFNLIISFFLCLIFLHNVQPDTSLDNIGNVKHKLFEKYNYKIRTGYDILEDISSSNSSIFGLVGGEKVSIKKHPYVVAIFIKTCFEGSGVVLNGKWIITSGWVVIFNKPSEITVKAGTSWALGNAQASSVDKVFVHPNYTYPFHNDIALIKLSKHLKFSTFIKPIKISHESPPDKSHVGFAGFGYYDIVMSNLTVKFDGRLREAKLNIISSSECKQYYTASYYGFSTTNFCTNTNDTLSPCLYDYGSPLIWKNKLVGIFSIPSMCKKAEYPSVYTDVSKLRGWIWNVIHLNTKSDRL